MGQVKTLHTQIIEHHCNDVPVLQIVDLTGATHQEVVAAITDYETFLADMDKRMLDAVIETRKLWSGK